MDSSGGERPGFDPALWETWRGGNGDFVAYRYKVGGTVFLRAQSADGRDEKIRAWENEHPDAPR
jgi:hypothetical protein